MRTNNLTIAISFPLILVFTIFTVGVPVMISLCPMANMEDSCCGMNPPLAGYGSVSFNPVLPECCTRHIIAEGNSTPYLTAERSKVLTLLPVALIAHETDDTYLVYRQPAMTEVLCISPSPPFPEKTSLSVLNSTFLI
jgi:hypothetical protein